MEMFFRLWKIILNHPELRPLLFTFTFSHIMVSPLHLAFRTRLFFPSPLPSYVRKKRKQFYQGMPWVCDTHFNLSSGRKTICFSFLRACVRACVRAYVCSIRGSSNSATYGEVTRYPLLEGVTNSGDSPLNRWHRLEWQYWNTSQWARPLLLHLKSTHCIQD